MEVYLDAQLWQLFWAFVFGGIAGVLYDFIRVVGTALGNRKRHFFKDALFWALTILSVFFFNVAVFSGETSFYFPFAMGVGAMVYLHLFSGVLSFVFSMLVFPLQKLKQAIKKLIKNIRRRLRRRKQAVKMRREMKKVKKELKKAVENANLGGEN